MNPTVYVETTIVSYLTAWPSRDVIRLAHEVLTRQWWSKAPGRFSLYTSRFVMEEASAGDPAAAAERLRSLATLPQLDITDPIIQLANELARALNLPLRARADSFHAATAAYHGMDFLLTWNCRHLANAALAATMERVCITHGVACPRICTPEQLMEAP